MGRLTQSPADAGGPVAQGAREGADAASADRTRSAGLAAAAAFLVAFVVAAITLVFDIPRQVGPSGAQGVELSGVSLSVEGSTLSARAIAAAGVPRTIRAWVYLAPAGSTTPWLNYEYRSAIIERQLRPGEPASLRWYEPLILRDGVYEPSIWFEEWQGTNWVPLTDLEGDRFPIAEFKTGNTAMRLPEGGGPGWVRVTPRDAAAGMLRAAIEWQLFDGVEEAAFSWELHPAGSQAAAFTSRPAFVGPSGETPIEMAMALPVGVYDLWIWLRSTEPEGPPTRLVYEGAFASLQPKGYTRELEPLGEGTWEGTGPVPELASEGTTALPFRFAANERTTSCRAFWGLYLGADAVSQGSAGTCDAPVVTLPVTPAGRYSLHLSAQRLSPSGSESIQIDAVRVDVDVRPSGPGP